MYDTGQTKYDFGWKQQGNASWTEALGIVTTQQSRTLDTNSMPTGIIEWRVRTYNANNAVSEYAYGAFELTGRPTAPIIDTMKMMQLQKLHGGVMRLKRQYSEYGYTKAQCWYMTAVKGQVD
uniref:hypothetical protein n=1 Tax=Clostridium sp. NkU-1 TaxID=1095009 RepID=UPI0006D0A9EC